MTNILDLIGRIFISIVFLLSGFHKIGNYEGTVGWMESFGLPGFLLIPAIILSLIFVVISLQLLKSSDEQKQRKYSKKLFLYSILYLFLIYILFLVDYVHKSYFGGLIFS